MRIAVAIPCYKVTQHVLDVIAAIGPDVETIYAVDDACPEGSGRFIEANNRDPRVRVLFHASSRRTTAIRACVCCSTNNTRAWAARWSRPTGLHWPKVWTWW